MVKDKYKDPINSEILKEISETIERFKRSKYVEGQPGYYYYRVGIHAGMNIVLKKLGRDPL
jgi:hypothetical protein